MPQKIIILIAMLFSAILLYGQDANRTISRIQVIGLKNSYNRVMKELPVHEGGVWNDGEKKKLIGYYKKLQDDGIFDDSPFKIDEIQKDSNLVELKIYVNEKMSWFMFVIPKWGSNSGLQPKFKYWLFYVNGYKVPIELELEFLQKDSLNLAVRSSEQININDRLSTQFELKTYTTSLNYALSQNSDWANGIENLFGVVNYRIPGIELTLSPGLGFGYGNKLKTLTSNKLDTAVIEQYHATILNPRLGITYPIPENGATISSNFGFGYKNIYDDNISSQRYTIQEISLSLLPNNPRSISDPLSYPINVSYTNPIPYINATFNTSLNFAYKSSDTSYKNYAFSSSKYYQSQYDAKFFDNTILASLSDGDKAFIKSKYTKNGNKGVYNINSDVTDAEKILISDMLSNMNLINDSFTYYSGIYINPTLGFTFPVKSTGLSVSPGLQLKYYYKWQPDPLTYNAYDNRNEIDLIPNIGMSYAIPFIDATVSSNIEFWYTRIWRDFPGNTYFYDKISLKNTYIAFEKKFYFDDYYFSSTKTPDSLKQKANQTFFIAARFKYDPIFSSSNIPNILGDQKTLYSSSINDLTTTIEGSYELYLPAYKYNKFKMRLMAFASNASYLKFKDSEDILGNWIRGNGYDFFGGWFGMVMNIEFWLNLFTFDTPKVGSFNLPKTLTWQMYWVFYADIGFGLANDAIFSTDYPGLSYTLNFNDVHILPAMTVGTAIKVFPKFVPLAMNIEINMNLYNFLKDKSFGRNLWIELSFSRYIEDSWFKR
jgi:hypothetical protein